MAAFTRTSIPPVRSRARATTAAAPSAALLPERIMKRFKSSRQVQRFLSAHDQVANVFLRSRDHDTAGDLRSGRTQAFATWADVTGVAMAA